MRVLLSSVAAVALWPATLWAQANPDLSSGGLAPPPAVAGQGGEPGQPAPNTTEQELAEAEREDAGRGLEFFWVNGEVGVGNVGLGTFSAGDLVDASAVETTQTGLVAGAALGFRLVYMTLGARFRYGAFSDWKLWSLGAEAGLHVPMGSLEPYFTLGLGYVGTSGLLAGGAGGPELGVKGVDARLGAGIDYYFTEMFSVGANLGGDIMFLSRGSVAGAAPGTDYASDGSSVGGGVTLTAVMGLHF